MYISNTSSTGCRTRICGYYQLVLPACNGQLIGRTYNISRFALGAGVGRKRPGKFVIRIEETRESEKLNENRRSPEGVGRTRRTRGEDVFQKRVQCAITNFTIQLFCVSIAIAGNRNQKFPNHYRKTYKQKPVRTCNCTVNSKLLTALITNQPVNGVNDSIIIDNENFNKLFNTEI